MNLPIIKQWLSTQDLTLYHCPTTEKYILCYPTDNPRNQQETIHICHSDHEFLAYYYHLLRKTKNYKGTNHATKQTTALPKNTPHTQEKSAPSHQAL